MSITTGFAGVSNCYIFKSRLHEYAQKAGFTTPMYETLKEGPPHQPCFQSTVIVDNVRYDSLPGFFNRKAAEQSAAEVALLELVKSGKLKEPIAHPIHETGFCKNLLQEYAQKMSYTAPTYVCHVDESPGIKLKFSCSVDVGGTHHLGTAASTKKEAEIKAARTALLAIQSSTNGAEAKPNVSPQLTVLPGQKEPELDTKKEEAKKSLKRRKNPLNERRTKRAAADVENSKDDQVTSLEVNKDGHGNEGVGSQANQLVSITDAKNNSENTQTTASIVNPYMEIVSGVQTNDLVTPEAKVNSVTEVAEVTQIGAADVPVATAGEKDLGLENSLGVVQVIQISAADVPVGIAGEKSHGIENSLVVLNQNEEGQKLVEAGDVQRIPERTRSAAKSNAPDRRTKARHQCPTKITEVEKAAQG